MSDNEPMSKSEIESLVDDAATRASRQVLREIGIDADEWREHQRDMEYLRQMRQGSENIRAWGKRSTVGVVITAVAWVLWEGLKAWIKAKGGS